MQIKILTIGDSSVGKTALLNQFANKQFSNAAIPTIGIGASTCRSSSSTAPLTFLTLSIYFLLSLYVHRLQARDFDDRRKACEGADLGHGGAGTVP